MRRLKHTAVICLVLGIVSALTLVVAPGGRAAAQPAVAPGDETCVVESTASWDTPPAIGVQRDGSCWIVCETGNIRLDPWLHSDSGFVACNTPKCWPLPLADGRWMGFISTDACTMQNGSHFRDACDHRMAIFEDGKIVARSPIIHQCSAWNDSASQGFVTHFSLNVMEMNGRIVMFDDSLDQRTGTVNTSHYEARVKIWDPATDAVSGAPIPGSARDDFALTHEGGYPLVRAVPDRGGAIRVYVRERVAGGAAMRRTLLRYDGAGTMLDAPVVLDSIGNDGTDFSDLLLPAGSRGWYIVRRTTPGDSIVAECISDDGRSLGTVSTGITHVRERVTPQAQYLGDTHASRTMDASVRALPGGRYVVAWSAADSLGWMDCTIAFLDSTMTMIGRPMRLNAQVKYNQYNPDLAVKGDTVYAVWLSTELRPAEWWRPSIFLRRFTLDQVLAADRPEVPTAPTFSAWPDPARDMITAAVAGFGAARIDLVDLLGRVVLTRDIAPLQGRISLPCRDVPTGVYILRVVSDKMPVVRRIRIVR